MVSVSPRLLTKVSDMDVVELFFYIFLTACVLLQTWGFSFSNKVYLGAVASAAILVSSKLLSARYTSSELFISLVLLAFGLYFAFRSHRYTVLLTSVLLISAKDIDTDRVLRGYFYIKTFALVSLFLLAAFGVFDMTTVQHFRMTTGALETRALINGAATNIVHLGYFTVVVLWLYLNFCRLSFRHLVFFSLLDFALYVSFTRSVAGLMLTLVAIALFYIINRCKRASSFIVSVAPYLPICLLAVMCALGYLYGSTAFIEFLNRLSTGRIAYDHYWLTKYGPSVFGADYSSLISEGNFDDSFVYLVVVYGLVFAVFLYGLVSALLAKIKRGGDAPSALLVSLFLIYSAVESMYPSAVVNPSLFLLCRLIYPGKHGSAGIGNGEYGKTGGIVGAHADSTDGLHFFWRTVRCWACCAGLRPTLHAAFCDAGKGSQGRGAYAAGIPSRVSKPDDRFRISSGRRLIGEPELSYTGPVCCLYHSFLLDSRGSLKRTDCRRFESLVFRAAGLVLSDVRRRSRRLLLGSAGYPEKPFVLVHGVLCFECGAKKRGIEKTLLPSVWHSVCLSVLARFYWYGYKLAGLA